MNNSLFHFSSIKRDYERCVKFIVEFVDEIIKSKFEELDDIGNSAQVNTDGGNVYQTPKTILEILLQSSHEMSLKQIRDEIFTIISGKYQLNFVCACINCRTFLFDNINSILRNILHDQH